MTDKYIGSWSYRSHYGYQETFTDGTTNGGKTIGTVTDGHVEDKLILWSDHFADVSIKKAKFHRYGDKGSVQNDRFVVYGFNNKDMSDKTLLGYLTPEAIYDSGDVWLEFALDSTITHKGYEIGYEFDNVGSGDRQTFSHFYLMGIKE